MIDSGKHNILGVSINAIDYEGAVQRVIDAAKNDQHFAVTALAVHGVMTGALDNEHRYRLNHLDLVCPDGMPVRWALNSLHKAGLSDRVYGPTLTLKICERAAQEGIPIYFYGSKQDVLEKMVANLREKFPNIQIAGYQPSRFRQVTPEEKVEIAEEIKSSGAKIVFVGLGCPRQETWVFEMRDLLPMPAIAVGAAFDFHAGTLPQAPPRLQRMGLEWAFRLYQEPGRLWRRYLYLNPLYLSMLALQVIGIRRVDPESATPPTQEMRYG